MRFSKRIQMAPQRKQKESKKKTNRIRGSNVVYGSLKETKKALGGGQ